MNDANFKALPILDQPASRGSGSVACGDHDAADHAALTQIRDRLARVRGKDYWRSLDELSDTPEFRKFLEDEFPSKHELWMEPVTRRDFLKLMGAGMAMMFFSGCRKPLEKIFPYQEYPENLIPGKPLYYASALTHGGYAQGVIVETHEGRPTKIEGNPQHPDSLGATDVFMQASVLGLYDPDRSQTVVNTGMVSSWESLLKVFQGEMVAHQAVQGAGLRILSGTVTSPTLAAQMKQFLKKYPKSRWIQYEPLARHHAAAGAELAFGERVAVRYALENADVILSLDADFLGTGPDKLRNARRFAEGRNLVDGRREMNRLYVVEPSPTITGATADHRLPMRASEVAGFAAAVADELGVSGAGRAVGNVDWAKRWIQGVAQDLRGHRGRSVVMA
ncbi:MAG TPA: TAT-variant-translocated molybdopterin oxidoreductase, partial [Elusimicrobiota bacterium]|nr:TAT-variant-translocated molybdopterin oxidoreductase [Elusimicrobiota bacterium]